MQPIKTKIHVLLASLFDRGRNDDLDDASKWFMVTVCKGRVTRVMWQGLGLEGTIPAEVGALSAIEKLNLAHNPGLSGEVKRSESRSEKLKDPVSGNPKSSIDTSLPYVSTVNFEVVSDAANTNS